MTAGWLESVKSLFGRGAAKIAHVVATIRTPLTDEELTHIASFWVAADFENLSREPEVRARFQWDESQWRQTRVLAEFTPLAWFSVLGMMIDRDRLPELEQSPAVRRVFVPDQDFAYDYLNILKGLHRLILPEDGQLPTKVDVVNISLQPWEPYPFDELEPMNWATRILAEQGITVVAAAGNFGERGENTLNPWSVAPWVIGVGATLPDGKALWPGSSRGVHGDDLYHPTVVAVGVDSDGHEGTSFAAPKVAGLVASACEFVRKLARAPHTAQWVAQARQMDLKVSPVESRPAVVKRMIEDMAVPVEGCRRHEVGAGFVDRAIADRYFAEFRLSNFIKVFCQL
jgi:hypothetical protein